MPNTFAPASRGLPKQISMCRKCLKWRDYATGNCPVCQQVLDIEPWSITKEIDADLAETLLALQDTFDLHTPKDNDTEEQKAFRAAADPRYPLNHSVQDIRRQVGVLRGLAAQHGIYLQQGTDIGEEISIVIDGAEWRAFRRKRDGHIVPIAPVVREETGPDVAQSGGNAVRAKHTHGRPPGADGWATHITGCPVCEASRVGA